MFDRFTDRARKVMGLARQAAQAERSATIGTEHILLGLVEEGSGVAANVLRNLDVTLDAVHTELRRLTNRERQPPPSPTMLPFTPRSKQTLVFGSEEASNLKHNYIGTEHLLLGLLRVEEGVASQALRNLGLRLDEVREEVLELLGADMTLDEATEAALERLRPLSKTPALDAFTTDLVALSRSNQLPVLAGREEELDQLIASLARREHANALVVGPEGVGRRSLVRLLAHRIASNDVPEFLRGTRLLEVEINELVTGPKFRGPLEDRVHAMCADALRDRKVVLYFDDFDALLHWPGGGKADRLFQPFTRAVNRGQLRCIGRLNENRYETWATRAPEVLRLFDPLPVAAPAPDLLAMILQLESGRLEAHHGVTVRPDAIEAAARAPAPPGLALPAAAIKLLDTACAESSHRTDPLPSVIKGIDVSIRKAELEKEEAVAEQDFQRAAAMRDRADRLKCLREKALRGRSQRRRAVTIGAAQVERLAGRQASRTKPKLTATVRALPTTPAFEHQQAQSVLQSGPVEIQRGTALVLLPAGPGAIQIYQRGILPALRANGLETVHLCDPYLPGETLRGLSRHLRSVEVVIADASARDPGVACALGLCLGNQRYPLLLTHDVGDLPAALRNLRTISYDPTDLDLLGAELCSHVREFLAATRVEA